MPIVACSIEGCEKHTGIAGTARGFCSKHYNRFLRNGDPLIRTQRTITSECTVEGCGKPHDAKGLCSAHITILRRHGVLFRRKPGAVVDGKKICPGCGEDKPTSDYYRRGTNLTSRCKPCAATYSKAFRESRIETVREQARAAAARRPLQRRDAARKRRASLRAVAVENVSAMDVFDRDEWMCGICSHPIPRVVTWPHPLSPSLDHILALSMGGNHSYANTQASHLACNMSKGARIPA